MLHFQNMVLNNFGPYKNEQTIDFSNSSGVTIFWGNNGRGKTTLLNAFRYALFGVVQRRNGELKKLSDMENLESRNEGNYGFSVKLTMKNDDDIYELTRQHTLRKGVSTPNGEEDYERKVFLKKNGAILSPDDRDHELNQIMPEQISRFFLFDAELLQEYEELLEIDTSTGDKIKIAIEKILGLPVIQNGVLDIQNCLSTYETQRSKAAQKDSKTVQLGQQLEAVEKKMLEHEKVINTARAELSTVYKQSKALEERMSETEKLRDWISARDNAQKTLNTNKDELEDCTSRLKTLLKTSWKGMLIPRIGEIKGELESQISDLDSKKQKGLVADSFIMEMKKAVQDRSCPVCGQSISSDLVNELSKKIADSSSEFSGLSEEEKEKLFVLRNQKNIVDRLSAPNNKAEIRVLEENRDKLLIRNEELKQEIKDLEENIKNMGGSESEVEISQLASDYAKSISEISIRKKGLEDEQAKYDACKAQKQQISAAIDKQASGVDYKNANRRYEICQKIFDIFNESKTRYREKLKDNVERDATSLFVKLTGDPDYVGLQINANYGLSIVHSSGNIVPGRSSGYEHIVALSLIGALHKNAPLRGPIIMDSPFGRLDPTHKTNIIKTLPEMADQIVLLAYFGEIDEQIAREKLGSNLIHEYKLERVTSMHTKLS